jgi:hypothetical protein
MTNATEHAVTECWTVSLELVDESGHCVFKFGVIARIILFAKSIDATLAWGASTTAKTSLGRRSKRLERALGSSQVVAQGNGEVAGRQLVASEWVKRIESSCSNKAGRRGTVLYEGVHNGGRVEI